MDFKVRLYTEEELSVWTVEGKEACQILGIDPRKQLIELQTGGLFDTLPIHRKKDLEMGAEILLKAFGTSFISALQLDYSMALTGNNTLIGVSALTAGLEEIERRLKAIYRLNLPRFER